MAVLVERVHLRSRVLLARVVHYDVYHQPHVACLQGSREGGEVGFSAEVRVERLEVSGPIAVLAFVEVQHERGDPDRIESHVAYLVELSCKAQESASTVV